MSDSRWTAFYAGDRLKKVPHFASNRAGVKDATRTSGGALTATLISLGTFGSSTQSVKTSEDALVAALVWGRYDDLDLATYPLDLKAELERARERFKAYRSPRRRSGNSPLDEIVHAAMVRYERMLVSAAGREAQSLAVEYVDKLRPCYEWEGYHDCPEHEAVFAGEYLAANLTPFKEYLPLLAGHRWLWAAEAYGYEARSNDAYRSRRAADAAIQTARRSTALMIRIAAETLQGRGRCHFPG